METDRHEVLTDKLDIYFFELKKINIEKRNKPMEDWLNLINAETEDELMDIETDKDSDNNGKRCSICKA